MEFRLPFILFFLVNAGILAIGAVLFSMKADLTNPKLHWPIEGINISCQIIFCIGLLILF